MGPRFRRSVLVVYAVSFLQGCFGVTLHASGAVLRGRLALGDAAYGSVFLLMFTLALAVSLGGPWLLRRHSLKRLFLFALGAEAVALCLLALAGRATNPGWGGLALLGFALLAGPSMGALGISLNTAAIGLFPRARGGALSALHALLGAGATVWPLAIAAAAASGVWPTAPLALAAAFAAAWGVSVRVRLRGLPQRIRPEHARADLPAPLRRRAWAMLVYGAGEAVFTVWAVVLLFEVRRLPMTVAAGALSAFWLAMTGGRLAAVAAVRVIPERRLALGLAAGMAVSFLLVAGARGTVGSLAAYALAGLCCSALFPLVFALASAELPERTPQVSAILSAAVMAGLALGGFGVGPLRRAFPLEQIHAGAALIPLILGVLLWPCGSRASKAASAPVSASR